MKLIIAVLLLAIGAFAQYHKFNTGDCVKHYNIESVYYIIDANIYESKYTVLPLNIYQKWEPSTNYKFDKIYADYYKISCPDVPFDTAFWYNSKTSSYCTIKATTPINYVYTTLDYCENATTTYKWAEEFREELKIKACKASFTSKNKSKLYDYLDKCVKYTTIDHDSPYVSYTLCGITPQNSNGTATRPSSCDYDASWFKYRK